MAHVVLVVGARLGFLQHLQQLQEGGLKNVGGRLMQRWGGWWSGVVKNVATG